MLCVGMYIGGSISVRYVYVYFLGGVWSPESSVFAKRTIKLSYVGKSERYNLIWGKSSKSCAVGKSEEEQLDKCHKKVS